MTQEEKLLARLKTLDPGLHEIKVYLTPEGKIGFWIVVKSEKVEGVVKSEQKG